LTGAFGLASTLALTGAFGLASTLALAGALTSVLGFSETFFYL
jgi:hypothetical protein